MIYLDNAATTLRKPPCVAQAVMQAMGELGNCARGAHDSALSAARTVYEARCCLADLFGCARPDHVIFTANATEALNIAINGLFSPGEHIISTDLEHNSVLRPLYRLEAERNVSVSFVPADRSGRVDEADFERLIRPETKAVVCTHASNLTGDLLALQRISAVCRAHRLLLVADCSQTAGCLPVDMDALGIDVLCFTGHKGLMGPQGTGGLCIREGVELLPWKVGGSGVLSHSRTQPSDYPTRLEAGTLNAHGIAGLLAAVRFLQKTGVEAVHAKQTALMRRFFAGVKELPNVTVYGDFSADRAAIVSLNIGTMDSGLVSDALFERYGIATRSGIHCAPRIHAALGTAEQGAVRFSFSCYNTEAETDAAIAAVRELAEE